MRHFLFACLLVVPALAVAAQETPSAEAVRAVWDFYYRGQGQGFVLVEARACLEVATQGPNRGECVRPVPEDGVKAGTQIAVWQAYLAPHGELISGVQVELRQGDAVRASREVKVRADGWRVRVWSGFRIPGPGHWTLVVTRGRQVLATLPIEATP